MMAGDETSSSEPVPSMTASQQQRHGARREATCTFGTRPTFHVKSREQAAAALMLVSLMARLFWALLSGRSVTDS